MTEPEPITAIDFELSREGDLVTIRCEEAEYEREFDINNLSVSLNTWRLLHQGIVRLGSRDVYRRIWIQVLEKAVKL